MPLTENTIQIFKEIEQAIAGDQLANSIFKNISLVQAKCTSHGANAKVLALNNITSEQVQEKADVQQKYNADKALFEEIEHAQAQKETAFYLLQKYGSRLASKSKDIPLFDNYRIEQITKGQDNFILLKGDFTGIQPFIYGGIKTDQIGDMRRVSKELRGKSFFVSMLTDLVAEQFLSKFKLSAEHLLFAGGGHFNILIPSDDMAMAEELAQIINTKLPYGLHLLLAHKNVSDFLNKGEAGKAFDAVNSLRDRKKYNSYDNSLSDIFNREHTNRKDNISFVKIGGLLPKTEYIIQVRSSNPEFNKTDNFKKIYSLNLPDYTESLIAFTPNLGNEETIDTLEVATAMDTFFANQTNIESAKILRLNNTEFLNIAAHISEKSFPLSYAFRFVGNYAPISEVEEEDNYLADFEELSKKAPKEWDTTLELTGKQMQKRIDSFYPKLAFMRLDIDDLGAVFSIGQKKNPDKKVLEDYKSLKHTAVLSRELNLFFSGHINFLAKKHQCYVVYSGGDDAFLVGSWLNIIFFVKELRHDFKRFVCGNTELNFSAGIFTCHFHYPIAKAAKDSGTLEERAKTEVKSKFDLDGKAIEETETKSKNSICIFGQTLTFDSFNSMTDLGELMIKHTSDKDGEIKKKLSKSLVYKILGMLKHSFEIVTVKDKEGNLSERKKMNPYKFNLNRARIHNLFARHGFDEKNNQKAVDDLTNRIIMIILRDFSENNQFALQDYTVALNYVLFNIRKPRNN